MALFGGTFEPVNPPGGGAQTAIYYVSQGSLTANSSETTIAVSFKATSSTVVLAWGGHIARGDQWNGASASAISGSPYHMRTKSWNLNNVGNQDRSLSADAVINPPKLMVVKQVVNDDGGNAVPGDFTMNVSGGATPSSFPGQVAPGTTVNFPDTATYAVTESGLPMGYTQTNATTDCTGTIQPDATKTCTITNDDVAPTLKLVKNVDNLDGGNALADNWTLTANAAGTDKDDRDISTPGGSDSPSNVYSNKGYALAESPNPGAGYTARILELLRHSHPRQVLAHGQLGHARGRCRGHLRDHERRRRPNAQARQERRQRRRRRHPGGRLDADRQRRRHAQGRQGHQRCRRLDDLPHGLLEPRVHPGREPEPGRRLHLDPAIWSCHRRHLRQP